MNKMNIIIISLMVVMSLNLVSASDIGEFVETTLVNQDPDPALAGDLVEIRLGVSNPGSASISGMQIKLSPKYPFSLVSGENQIKEVGSLASYQDNDNIKVVKFIVLVDRTATAGTYELDFVEILNGVETGKSVEVDIKTSENVEIDSIDQTVLIPGKISELKFTISNVGSAPLRDITFSWENEDDVVLPVGADNSKYIKYLDIGMKQIITFDVIADTNVIAGLYKLNLDMKYDDTISGEENRISTKAGIYVGGGTDFEVTFSEQSLTDTSFTIANIGSNPASSVSVKIPIQEGVKISGSNSAIIGNLDKGDYTVASFQMTGKSDMITVQIDYTDTMGERKTIEKSVKVNSGVEFDPTQMTGKGGRVSGMNQSKESNILLSIKWPLIILGVLIIGFFIYRKYKNKR